VPRSRTALLAGGDGRYLRRPVIAAAQDGPAGEDCGLVAVAAGVGAELFARGGAEVCEQAEPANSHQRPGRRSPGTAKEPKLTHTSSTGGGTVYLAIKPFALPSGADPAIFVGGSTDHISMPALAPPGTAGGIAGFTHSTSDDGHVRTVVRVTVRPVYASQQCTG
jgi:hypothetical protein